jgi:predicted transcriptional regulator
MKAAELRSDLLHKIEGLNLHQLKDVYGLFQNYINGQESVEDWDQLTLAQRQEIEVGIRQANAGQTTPLSEVTAGLRKKYGLNG